MGHVCSSELSANHESGEALSGRWLSKDRGPRCVSSVMEKAARQAARWRTCNTCSIIRLSKAVGTFKVLYRVLLCSRDTFGSAAILLRAEFKRAGREVCGPFGADGKSGGKIVHQEKAANHTTNIYVFIPDVKSIPLSMP